MDFIIPEIPEEMRRFLGEYDGLFVRREMREQFRYYISGLISETQRKNVEQMMSKVVEGKYQSGHHFLANSPWDREELNKKRLEIWQGDKKTKMNGDGWFIQDDTGQNRRLRGKEKGLGSIRLKGGTDGVSRQYIGNVGKVSEGVVFVSTHYADNVKRVPVTADLYWPKESMEKLPEKEQTEERKRDKIEIALDQLRWSKENIKRPFPRRVISDSWYGSSPKYLNTIHSELKWTYIVGIRPNRKIFIRLPQEKGTPEHRAEEVLTLFKAKDFTKVKVMGSGAPMIKWAVLVNKKYPVKIKGLRHRPRLFLCVDDPSQIDSENVDFILCNKKELSLTEVIQAKSLRNWEEVFYRQGKDFLGLDQCEAQMEEKLLRHWTLVMVTYTMLETFRVREDLSNRTNKALKTIESIIRLLRDLFRFEFWMKWMKDEDHLRRFAQWFCETRGLKVDMVLLN